VVFAVRLRLSRRSIVKTRQKAVEMFDETVGGCVLTTAARTDREPTPPSARASVLVPALMSLSIDAGTVKEYAVLFGALLSAIVFGTYWVPKLIVSLLPTQNLKKKYDAEWALVTGSSSGIGKSIAFALAKQGVNVVLVALQEPLLDETFEELKASFGDRKFLRSASTSARPDTWTRSRTPPRTSTCSWCSTTRDTCSPGSSTRPRSRA
jgi:NADPH:quinone reductase-like Zn-dependent oxidoreductase